VHLGSRCFLELQSSELRSGSGPPHMLIRIAECLQSWATSISFHTAKVALQMAQCHEPATQTNMCYCQPSQSPPAVPRPIRPQCPTQGTSTLGHLHSHVVRPPPARGGRARFSGPKTGEKRQRCSAEMDGVKCVKGGIELGEYYPYRLLRSTAEPWIRARMCRVTRTRATSLCGRTNPSPGRGTIISSTVWYALRVIASARSTFAQCALATRSVGATPISCGIPTGNCPPVNMQEGCGPPRTRHNNVSSG
jgi:hypothetical protein